jgi:hypothetical protein
MLDLLTRQGVDAARLGGPLASLPLPKAGERAPTVVVDVDRTALDDETRAHLMAWTEAGGTLVLVAHPDEWPKELHASEGRGFGGEVVVRTRLLPIEEDDPDLEDYAGAYITRARATLMTSDAIQWLPRPEVAAAYVTPRSSRARGLGGEAPVRGGDDARALDADAAIYAGIQRVGRGVVLGVATDELLTNVALLRGGNAEALLALFANVEPSAEAEGERAGPWRVRVALPEDGIAPASNPIAELVRAGLGLFTWHALAAALVLFLAVGTRLGRARPAPPAARRAFVEHIEATGTLYARARVGTHALAAYARWAEERVFARMPRGATDVPQFLASRTGVDVATCERVWMRARNARATDAPRGDELLVLKELRGLVAGVA